MHSIFKLLIEVPNNLASPILVLKSTGVVSSGSLKIAGGRENSYVFGDFGGEGEDKIDFGGGGIASDVF